MSELVEVGEIERRQGLNDILNSQMKMTDECIGIADRIKNLLSGSGCEHKLPEGNSMMEAMKLHTEQIEILREHLFAIADELGAC